MCEIVYHITNLESALNIWKTKEYIPANCWGDRGLNCFIKDVKYNGMNSIPRDGVEVYFRWYGEIVRESCEKDIDNYIPNLLIDMQPWRAIISAPIEEKDKSLELISFDFYDCDDQLDLFLRKKFVYKYICLTKNLKNKYKKSFKESINRDLRKQHCFISIRDLTKERKNEQHSPT
ncbi:hypothetical protein [Lonepinella sp. MS14437]|uniref:hypothetical protein n=1 Tax=Lonepinella sp. MS14437 TaxID=3003620 RepID=UPI0036D9AAAA